MDYEAELRKCGDEALAGVMSTAIGKLLDHEHYLFEHSVHERTISATLAFYMRDGFTDYNVDPEYNKLGDDTKRANVAGVEKSVVPDIIVHRRGDPYDSNFLLIEIKSGPSGSTNADLAKLKGMRDTLRYKHALFIRFGTARFAGEVIEMHWVTE